MGWRHGDGAVEQGLLARRADTQRPDAADADHLTIQHGHAADLRQRARILAQALCRLGKVAGAERGIEEGLDGVGMDGRRFRDDLEHGERV